MSLASSISSLATRIATEIKAVRAEMAAYAKIQVPTATKTAAYTAAMNDIVMVDPTGGPITITLPVIGSQTGRISVKNLGGANVVTVAAGAGNTIGSTAAASVPVRYADQVTTFQADGTNWVIPYNHLPPTVLSTYAPLASPTFTGTVTVPYPSHPTDAANQQYAFDIASIYNSGAFLPSDHGLNAWTCDPLDASVTFQPAGNGYFIGSVLKVDLPFTCTNVSYMVTTAGATFTANRNYIGLYSAAGSLLRSTADQATNMTGNNFVRTVPWSAGSISLAAGAYVVGVIVTASTRPIFAARPTLGGTTGSQGNNAASVGRGGAGIPYRTLQSTAVQTAMPSTVPSLTGFPHQIWFALS